MSLQASWAETARSLDAPPAVKAVAAAMKLTRVGGDTFYFDTTTAVTKAAANKLVRAISRTLGVPVSLVVRQLPSGTTQRCYSDTTRAEN